MSGGGGFAALLSRTAVVSIALGVAVMVVSVAVLRGFQRDVREKVVGFGSHITVQSYAAGGAFEEEPVSVEGGALPASLRAVEGVRHVQCFASKGGMVKTDDQIQGIVLRGLDSHYDTSFFARCLTRGRLPDLGTRQPSTDVLVSEAFASRMRLAVGDKMRTYFWQGGTYRSRAFTVCGTYNTDLSEMDALYVVGDLRQVQRLNGWDSTQVGGVEILVSDFAKLDRVRNAVLAVLPYELTARTIVEANPALFSWLDLLDSNITLILVIMSIVCAIAVTSALLIMIFERRRTIGVLKTLGATNGGVMGIFVRKGGRLIVRGVAAGAALALALCFVQARWQLVTLDPESYSMSVVPVCVEGWAVALICAATLAVCFAAMLLPAAFIAKIHPAQTIKTDN